MTNVKRKGLVYALILTLCLGVIPFNVASFQAAAKTKIQYMRESIGKGVQVVMPNTKSGDYEGVINVTNSVALDDNKLTAAEACAWVAAATAGAKNTTSNTYVVYDGATAVVDPKSHEEAVTAINKGEFFFSVSEAGTVVVEYDINTLITFAGGKDKTYRKNRVVRVFDTFAEALQLNFPPVSSRAPVWGASLRGRSSWLRSCSFKSCPRVGGILRRPPQRPIGS